MRLRQDSNAGQGGGGSAGTGTGGAGGSATSKLTFNDETANTIDAGAFYGTTRTYSGHGGGGGAGAGKGGAATSGTYITGVNYTHATAFSRASHGGYVGGARAAAGGAANAVSHATATGSSAASRATAVAHGYAGIGTTQGAANVQAKATTAAGQVALSRALGSGGAGGAEAISVTATKGLVTTVQTSANAQVGSSASSETQAFANTSLGGFDDDNAYNFALALPSVGYIASSLSSNSAINTALGGPLATVFAAGLGGNRYAQDATGNRTYKGTTTRSLNSTTLTGNLILGLLDSNTLGTGFQSLTFTVAIEGATVLTKAFNAAQVANAATYFDNNAVNLGTVANDADLQVAINYTIVGSATGFGMSYVLGTTNDGVDTTPPPAPATPDLMAFADSGSSSDDNLTNVTAPTFSGSAEANSTVTLFSGATSIGSVKADAAGNWSLTTSVLAEGAHSITAKATDAAGNVSAASGALAITIDTTPPNAASTPDLDAASDSGSSNTDNITNDNTATFSGTADAGLLVSILINGRNFASGVADGSGKYNITIPAMGDSTYTITSMTTDAAGNARIGLDSLSVTIDTVAPAAPTDLDLITASDKGVSGTDDLTNLKTPTFAGKGEVGTTVTLFADAASVGSASVKADGTWEITAASLGEGTLSMTAKATDIAGNISDASTALAVTIDTTPPAAPTLLDLIAASDSGSSNSDDLTNVVTPTITGMAEANATVTVFSGVTAIGSVTADAAGKWSMTTGALAEGGHLITAKATDMAGNTGDASGALAITIDTTPPNAASTPDLDAASDTGSSSTDNVTNDTTATFIGTADAGLLVSILVDGGVAGTGIADGSGKYSVTIAAVADGAHAITSMTTDAAGNTKTGAGSLSITVDTVAPAAPTDLDLTTTSDKGSSSTDNITNVKTPIFAGKGTVGTTVTLFSGATSIGSAAVKADGTWQITAASLGDGAQSITAKATDVAGNVSAASTTLSVTIDTAAPAAPTTLDLVSASDSGASNTDNNTNDNTPTISGKAEVGATVAIFSTGVQVGQAKANASGVWAITTSALADGTHALRARATDVAGNTGVLSSTLNVVIDTKAPTTAIAPDLAAASDSGASNIDDLTNDNTASILGVTEAGASVDIFDGATKLTTLKADGAGLWSFTTAALSDGAHAITTVSTDAAGNVSAKSAALNLLIDTVAPTTPVMSVINPSVVSGTAEAGALVDLLNKGALIATTAADAGGAWSFAAPVGEGQHSLTVQATDTAGNTSTRPPAQSLEIGTADDDVLGTAGPNTYFGLGGDDMYFVDSAADAVMEDPGAGVDVVYASVGYTLAVGTSVEFLIAASGAGLALTGNGGDNRIIGGAGNDTITGGGGKDQMTGGLGADLFQFLALGDSTTDPAGRDTIADLSIAQGDLIGLSGIDADAGAAGDQAFTFLGAGAFTALAGQLRAQVGATTTLVSGDVNGDGTADFAIRLRGAITLTDAQFQL